jgi:hypothetical protein
MKVGDYIRNKYGFAKFVKIEQNTLGDDLYVFDNNICWFTDNEGNERKDMPLTNRIFVTPQIELDKVRQSSNIEDLIDALDLLFIDISPDDYGGIVVPRIAETERELEIWKKKFKSGEYILKGVVPKEVIATYTYWIGD